MHCKYSGFSLIETVIGIVVLAISFTLLTNMIYPLVTESADQSHQIRAAELGQSFLNEISARAFDENSDMSGGILRCGEVGANNCSTVLTNEEGGDRTLFDDVDDYNGLDFTGSNIENSLGESLGDLYLGYRVTIEVCNDAGYDGSCDDSTNFTLNRTAKLITVTVTTPLDFSIRFATYKANF